MTLSLKNDSAVGWERRHSDHVAILRRVGGEVEELPNDFQVVGGANHTAWRVVACSQQITVRGNSNEPKDTAECLP